MIYLTLLKIFYQILLFYLMIPNWALLYIQMIWLYSWKTVSMLWPSIAYCHTWPIHPIRNGSPKGMTVQYSSFQSNDATNIRLSVGDDTRSPTCHELTNGVGRVVAIRHEPFKYSYRRQTSITKWIFIKRYSKVIRFVYHCQNHHEAKPGTQR